MPPVGRTSVRWRPGEKTSVLLDGGEAIIAVRSSSDMTIGAFGRWPDSTRTRSARISAADW